MFQRALFALVCFGGAAAWPSLISLAEAVFISRRDLAARGAMCLSAGSTDLLLLGHCAACWAGSALLIGMGAAALLWRQTALRAAR